MYVDAFRDSDIDMKVEIIPKGCTGTTQLLDVYFNRQLKIFVRAVYHKLWLEDNIDATSRQSILNIQSLAHNQLCAPIFNDMIKYSWIRFQLIDF